MQFHNPEQALEQCSRTLGEHGGVAPSISRSSTFVVDDPESMAALFSGEREDGFLYSRSFNPTVNVLCRSLAALEATEAAMGTASGMAAIATTLLQLCRHGDHIVASDTIYGGSHALLETLLPQLNITTTFVDSSDPAAVEAAITPHTRVIYSETMGNPTLRIADIRALATVAHDHGLQLVVDNTFSPVVVTPALLGADVVVYSLTKFINGASDLIAGAICGSEAFIRELMDLHSGRIMLTGPTMDPRVAFDIHQRLPHLPLRMREHGRRAMAMAELLEDLGLTVRYPGLASHPQHQLFAGMVNQGYGYGGMLTLDCGSRGQAEELMRVLQNEEQFGLLAVSLGYFDTLISCSSASTSSEIGELDQQKMGLAPGLLRLAVGYTGSLEGRLHQLQRAVEKVLAVSV
ncbi:aminotransferase class I/II-fold pyridoxal phosphate-dependent enzyme [Desulfogranum mediterraneum]|uniref:aminotransferase class I/II-fold pyridoxal phosphate-dependent enzyme n=1 Tax=Desulfogranum mediterraneum TaxID=160661 RepID=UPI000407ED36|nr:aminotransferase class I/II-fold pyridoxal phosphate-dependent enzyme [Desulfogranum mediterraneum]